MSPFAQGLARSWRALGRDRRGSVLTEAAVILPFLVLLLLGGYDIARLALLQQKLSRTAIAVADMVSQGETISEPEVDGIMSATTTMLPASGPLASARHRSGPIPAGSPAVTTMGLIRSES